MVRAVGQLISLLSIIILYTSVDLAAINVMLRMSTERMDSSCV